MVKNKILLSGFGLVGWGILKWISDNFLFDWFTSFLETKFHIKEAAMIASFSGFVGPVLAALIIIWFANWMIERKNPSLPLIDNLKDKTMQTTGIKITNSSNVTYEGQISGLDNGIIVDNSTDVKTNAEINRKQNIILPESDFVKALKIWGENLEILLHGRPLTSEERQHKKNLEKRDR
jgi:hypothetical protein